MRYLIFLSVVMTAGCNSMTLQQYEAHFDAQYAQLMELERPVLSAYFDKKDFNHGLQYVCQEPDKTPYDFLFAAVPRMKEGMDNMQSRRGQFLLEKDSVLLVVSKMKKVQAKQVQQRNEVFEEYAHACMTYRTQVLNENVEYEKQRDEYRVMRYTVRSFADTLMKRLLSWQDSVETQGSIIGSSKSELTAQGWDKKSEGFISAYRMVSEMEALHKRFMGKVQQVENLQNRYASGAREDEEFYVGPYLVEHPDYEFHLRHLKDLQMMMQAFHDFHKTFKSRLN